MASVAKLVTQCVYAEDGKILLYDIESRSTRKVTTDSSLEYRYPNFGDSMKLAHEKAKSPATT